MGAFKAPFFVPSSLTLFLQFIYRLMTSNFEPQVTLRYESKTFLRVVTLQSCIGMRWFHGQP
ncbi:hypothetical protein Cflav_PD3969 [Pedosphaera parvula Ellin514]|uniref:Uncharacterized protein n=1 Tax=Pedosphaera parvula (strain Ellin514) TaxID=320771 RepID=B9XG90_PEDPL|nr:hypothetical protein Cflav_PD3969 [Pedosphaera parvula Ellin514]